MAAGEQALIAGTSPTACIFQKGEPERIDAVVGIGEKVPASKLNIDQFQAAAEIRCIKKGEVTVIGIFGDGGMQQHIRANYSNGMYVQLLLKKHLHQQAEARPVEAADFSSRLETKLRYQERTTTKNVFEGGQLIVERYDQEGKLIRRTPPGYLPICKTI
jgi:hypothetical protein